MNGNIAPYSHNSGLDTVSQLVSVCHVMEQQNQPSTCDIRMQSFQGEFDQNPLYKHLSASGPKNTNLNFLNTKK